MSLLYRYTPRGSHIDLHGLNIETGVALLLVTHTILISLTTRPRF